MKGTYGSNDMTNVNQLNGKSLFIFWSVISLIFLTCYYPTFLWLHFKYSALESNYSHGYLIPFISAYMIYDKRSELAKVRLNGSTWGFILIAGALLVHVLGVLGNIHFISGFSIIIYIAGCSLFLLGAEITKKIAYPLFFLIFMCPIPDAYIDIIALPMKTISTALALHLINFIGIPYIQEGFRIILASSTYVVGTPCNGMRSLISFLALGFLLLYFSKHTLWKKILLLTIIPPLSITLNGLRIAILLYIANYYGQDMAAPESPLHTGSGLAVFILGFITLMFILRLIHEERSH